MSIQGELNHALVGLRLSLRWSVFPCFPPSFNLVFLEGDAARSTEANESENVPRKNLGTSSDYM